MSDFGADPDFNQIEAVTLTRDYSMVDPAEVLGDQFTISSHSKVLKLCDGSGNIQVKIKYDPSALIV
ncbi:MAG: hypothetical protein PHP98_11285 [Kiritimatiellae bacterium]|nr:hypothetical protein [Kiritimatiellia bacterium]